MTIRAKAPLRLGFAGGGTDVSPYSDSYGGAVLNAAINMHAYCHIEEIESSYIEFESYDYDAKGRYELAERIEIDGTLDLYKHVYNRLVRDFNVPIRPFRLYTHSDAPYGSGLGGSSTLVVAIIQCFAEWWRLPLGEYDIAHLAYEIERVDAGLKGGKQDQYAATFGGFNYMEFYADRVIVNPLRIRQDVINELESSLLLCFTGRSRESANIIEKQISNAKSNNTASLDAMHQVKLDSVAMKEALLTRRLDLFARVLDASWQNKKKMADTISNPEIEWLYDYAKENGALAGKVSGAGGGGFMMFMVDPIKRSALKNAFESSGHKTADVSFSQFGVQSWVS